MILFPVLDIVGMHANAPRVPSPMPLDVINSLDPLMQP
jgi:hypothetical protein